MIELFTLKLSNFNKTSQNYKGFSGLNITKKPKINLLLNKARFYSNKPWAPVLFYKNTDTDKVIILQDNANKSGIYMWTNLTTGKRYVGSSVNLKRRFLQYYNVNRLMQNDSMVINRALLKYGYSNFSLSILEYCDIKMLMLREKHYFVLLKPEYNLALEPGSPSRGKGKFVSEETKDKIRLAAKNMTLETRVRMSVGQKTGQFLEVTDILSGKKTVYHAIRTAAKALNIDKRKIENYLYLNQETPVLNKYIFTKIGKPRVKINNLQTKSLSLEVTNIEVGSKAIYPSIGSAARALGLYQGSISLYLKEERKNPFKGKYIFKLIIN